MSGYFTAGGGGFRVNVFFTTYSDEFRSFEEIGNELEAEDSRMHLS
ncbi:hypothetical protein SAMN05421548_122109 [Paraburkholderia lycopersici]|uniref:Uncharacterized protein n=1 Tax=Paraburkholderia lycopersici TaxID=416944 RepID=A0A1G6W944_9BURK|nr:hypothetical protein SAMN05421548_122109 [Paraburkholderia lycopersici]